MIAIQKLNPLEVFMRTRNILSLSIGLAFFIFGTAAPLPASSGPGIVTSDFTIDNETIANCGDFLIIANGSGRNRVTTFVDRNGDPSRIAFQGRYRGTLTNSVTGFSLDDAPSVANIFVDLVRGTQTNVGAFFTVTVPGRGNVLLDAGRIVFDGQGVPIFIAGQHLPPDESINVLCNALG
jgi:hypothetical protein